MTTPVFEVKNLTYGYPGGIPALKDINFSIMLGEAVALVGANGSGKSTLLRMLDGLIFPSSGEIFSAGVPLTEKALQNAAFSRDFRSRVGLVFQDADVQLFSATVWDEVLFGPLQLGLPRGEVSLRCQETLELLGIEHLNERPPYRLSGGEKKKVSIASVISLYPRVLLLDEPTNGLDPHSQGVLIDFLINWVGGGNTLIFSTQDLDLVEELASRVIVLGTEHNIVADGKPEDFLFDAEFLLKTNLIHEHAHRHKSLVHRHQHAHEHQHSAEGHTHVHEGEEHGSDGHTHTPS
jgi:cobalt/nickel transport system ATP-binding protein